MSPIIIKIRNTITILTISMLPQAGRAQIFDFVEEMASEWAEQQVYRLVDDLTGSITSLGSHFWNDFVDYSARSSICEKAESLANFQVMEPNLSSFGSHNKIVVSGGLINTESTMSNVKSFIGSEFHRFLTSTSNLDFNSLGNGYIKLKCDSFLTAKDFTNRIHELNEVLSPDTQHHIDSINNNLNALILADLNSSPGLIPAFNSTPNTLHFYNQLKDSKYRTDPNELLYWAEQADCYRSSMPKKNKLIDPINLTFRTEGKYIEISSDDRILALYSPETKVYKVYYPEFLNFTPRPNHVYMFEHTVYTTETLGRIEKITFKSDKKLNKTKLKNPVKFKDIAKAISNEEKGTFYAEILKDFNIEPSTAYAVKINQPKQIKDSLKQYKKSLKKNKLTPENFTIFLKYSDFSPTPSSIAISTTENTTKTMLYNDYRQSLNYSKLSEKSNSHIPEKQPLNTIVDCLFNN